ncbi:SOS response-associated peptidase family protein [Verticiella sediminum]|nr:SOS response-associated peptidase family protein [Verticiella sediminum]
MRMRLAQSSLGVSYLDALGWNDPSPRPILDAAPDHPVLSPGDKVRVLHRLDHGAPAMAWLPWGYTPATDSQRRPDHYLHARVETALAMPALRRAWREGRCLVPLDAWFEWQGEAGNAIPYRIQLPRGAPLFAAAITDARPGRGKRAGSGLVLISAQEGNGLLDAQGHRPVVLAEEDARVWADPQTTPEHARLLALEFLLPPPAFEWQALQTESAPLPAPEDAATPPHHVEG